MKQHLSNRLSQKLVQHLAIGEPYVLQDLADLLEMDIASTLRKGVLNRRGENTIVLLINLQKAENATPYVDSIENDILHWEGQLVNRFVEERMKTGEYEFFIFVRNVTKTPFTYYGRAIPVSTRYYPPGTPCQSKFSLYEYAQSQTYQAAIIETYHDEPPYAGKTSRLQLVEQRTVQQQYRRQALQLWNNRCAVIGIEQPKILIASHIKPWRVAEPDERIDPKNSLILSPLYDKLFDLGIISFTPSDGAIKLSEQLSDNEYDLLGIDTNKRLSMVPPGTESYLTYHTNYIFNFSPLEETELTLLTS
jgi:hypothetical protein